MLSLLESASFLALAIRQVTLLEGEDRVGGHSWTVPFPCRECGAHYRAGTTYPVDAGYAYNPTMPSYQVLRQLERRHRIHMHGPLQQRIQVLRHGFEPIDEATHARLDAECAEFNKILEWGKAHPALRTVVFGLVTLRQLLWWSERERRLSDRSSRSALSRAFLSHRARAPPPLRNARRARARYGFSDDFFMLRLYPVVRFVIVSGSKGKMLDAPALGALTTFFGGWGTCERALHADKEHGGSDWFTVRHGSEAHVRALRKELRGAIRTGAPVERVTELDGAVEVAWGGARPGTGRFDAVVLATPPDDAAKFLGDAAPSWLRTMSTESLTVAVHSDERAVPPSAAQGADRDANMIYVAGDARPDGDYSKVRARARAGTRARARIAAVGGGRSEARFVRRRCA